MQAGSVGSSGGSVLPTEPLDRLDTLSPQGLERWWWRRVRRVLAIAFEELPFYRRRFAEVGLHPKELRGLADLGRVPSFGKADLLGAIRAGAGRGAGIERRAPGDAAVLAASSGTQGTSFVELPPRWRREQGRSSLRAHWWAGLRPGAPFLLSAPAWHTYATVQSWIAERLGMPTVVVAGTYLPRFAARIADAMTTFRPRFMTMFLPMVFSLLAEARRRGLGGREIFASLDVLTVSGAPITPGMRARLERETGVGRITELAGSSENLLAVECAARAGLHVVPDTCYAQLVDPATGEVAAAGARGRIVHTALVPWGSLYVRYDGGDVATWDPRPCGCGLPSPRIKLLGRAEDGFELGGARLLPYDVQLAVEEGVPELAGVPFSIVREGLVAGRLSLVLPEQEAKRGARASPGDALQRVLAQRLQVPVDVRFGPDLALRFKGVAGIVGEREVA
jgi:phenylacetate-CoA ligase